MLHIPRATRSVLPISSPHYYSALPTGTGHRASAPNLPNAVCSLWSHRRDIVRSGVPLGGRARQCTHPKVGESALDCVLSPPRYDCLARAGLWPRTALNMGTRDLRSAGLYTSGNDGSKRSWSLSRLARKGWLGDERSFLTSRTRSALLWAINRRDIVRFGVPSGRRARQHASKRRRIRLA